MVTNYWPLICLARVRSTYHPGRLHLSSVHSTWGSIPSITNKIQKQISMPKLLGKISPIVSEKCSEFNYKNNHGSLNYFFSAYVGVFFLLSLAGEICSRWVWPNMLETSSRHQTVYPTFASSCWSGQCCLPTGLLQPPEAADSGCCPLHELFFAQINSAQFNFTELFFFLV